MVPTFIRQALMGEPLTVAGLDAPEPRVEAWPAVSCPIRTGRWSGT